MYLGTKIRKKSERRRAEAKKIMITSLLRQKKHEIGQITGNQQDSLPAAKLATGIGYQPEQDATAYEHEPVHLTYLRDRHRDYAAASADDESDVEDVAAYDIAECQSQTAFSGCHDAGGKFGQAGASCQDCRTNDALAHMALISYLHGIVHQDTTAKHQSCHTDKDEQNEIP